MTSKRFMLIAGETSGDLIAGQLVEALKPALKDRGVSAEFFGAGGSRMAGAGVELDFDMTAHAVVGLWEVLKKYRDFKRLFDRLLRLAFERRPDVIVLVDFSGFNRRIARALKERVRQQSGAGEWNPKIVYYVSPQVWASRPGRAKELARDIDLLLCILPFEQAWYQKEVPDLEVKFVGHPLVDRYAHLPIQHGERKTSPNASPLVLLLPGSRRDELRRHLPVMLDAARLMAARKKIQWRIVLPDESLAQIARAHDLAGLEGLEIKTGGLAESLAEAGLAIASTGTVTLECAWFRVPTVALYKTSWLTYQVGRRIIQVEHLAMPNLLAGETVFPEFIQNDATPANLAREAFDLLDNTSRREQVIAKLEAIARSLGEPGASARAAKAVADLAISAS